MIKNDVCLYCGQSKECIKRNKTICATVTYEGETDQEWPRHRFKPWSPKELEYLAKAEAEILKQMGDMAESYDKWAEEENKKLIG